MENITVILFWNNEKNENHVNMKWIHIELGWIRSDFAEFTRVSFPNEMSHQNKSSEFVKRRVIAFSFKKYGWKLVCIIRRVVTIFSTIMSKNVSKWIGLPSLDGTIIFTP